jgi:hypothetical protein
MSHELAKMPAIYGGTMVVISAARAESCTQGFLHRRDISSLLKMIYNLPHYPTGEASPEGCFIVSERLLSDKCEIQPIDIRAWTFQEHIQATCLLRFSPQQVRWKCLQPNSEWVDGGYPGNIAQASSDPEIFDGTYNSRSALIEHVGVKRVFFNFSHSWRDIIRDYTTRSLSRLTDSLPALGVIAHNYDRRTKYHMGCYCAGLWEKDLALGLLWFKPKTLNVVARQKPSWSWASLPGPVEYSIPFIVNSNLKVIDCVIERHNQNWAYGEVVSGTLTLQGRLWQLSRTHPTEMQRDVEVYWDITTQWDKENLTFLEVIPANDTEPKSKGLVLHCLSSNTYERVGYYQYSGRRVDEAYSNEEIITII